MRLAQAGAVMINWTALASELMGDWTRPNAAEVGEIYQQHSNWAGL
ncbi:hypothetical protein N836_34495 [Leptolyngbya sp. Heron Island J]|nr:hypothetical protein [Leptolyngbya sp. Heron Island J]ESA37905.1 hypothetical protein N836_34495 [Leptolyngbya sp. Heron Island J]